MVQSNHDGEEEEEGSKTLAAWNLYLLQLRFWQPTPTVKSAFLVMLQWKIKDLNFF